MTEQNEIERGATPELAEKRPELSVDWEQARKGKTFSTRQGNNRLKVFKEIYRGMPYEIHVIYERGLEDYEGYDHGMWATLEQPTEVRELYQAIEQFLKYVGAYISEDEGFCFGDTASREGRNINERILEMRKMAHYQIDLFYEKLSESGKITYAVNSLGKAIEKLSKIENALKTEDE